VFRFGAEFRFRVRCSGFGVQACPQFWVRGFQHSGQYRYNELEHPNHELRAENRELRTEHLNTNREL
jgi:hypothetical protein